MNINDLIITNPHLENLNLDIMFGATPKTLVSDISKKINKRKTKNLFYILFGVQVQETSQYIIFSSIFKSSRKKHEGNLFVEVSVDHAIYERKEDVLNYIYDFLSNFSEHDRIINEEIMSIGMMPAIDAYKYLIVWSKSIFDYFNILIESENKKKTGLFKKLLG